MNDLSICVGVYAVEAALLLYAARRADELHLYFYAILMSVFGAIIGPRAFTVFGFATTVTVLLHASTYICILIILSRVSGKEAVARYSSLLVFSMVGLYTLPWLVLNFDVRPGNEVMSAALQTMFGYVSPRVLAVVVANVIGVSVIAIVAGAVRWRWWWPAPALLAGQVANTLIFFPMAFSNLPPETMVGFMLTSLATKLAWSVLLVPVFILATMHRPPRPVND